MTFGGPIKCPKPPAHATVKEARKKAERAHRLAVRAEVWARDTACRLCGEPFAGPHDGEMHEIHPRSQTRGQCPELRFNLANCVRLHRQCHADTSALRLAGLLCRSWET